MLDGDLVHQEHGAHSKPGEEGDHSGGRESTVEKRVSCSSAGVGVAAVEVRIWQVKPVPECDQSRITWVDAEVNLGRTGPVTVKRQYREKLPQRHLHEARNALWAKLVNETVAETPAGDLQWEEGAGDCLDGRDQPKDEDWRGAEVCSRAEKSGVGQVEGQVCVMIDWLTTAFEINDLFECVWTLDWINLNNRDDY